MRFSISLIGMGVDMKPRRVLVRAMPRAISPKYKFWPAGFASAETREVRYSTSDRRDMMIRKSECEAVIRVTLRLESRDEIRQKAFWTRLFHPRKARPGRPLI